MKAFLFVLVTGLLAFVPYRAVARDHDPHERNQGKHHDFDDKHDRDHRQHYDRARFGDEHLRIIRDYYHPGGLPPGLQKKYYRTGQLPPGWQKKVRPFPHDLERRMPPICDGCARGYVDGFAVVYQPQTGLVIDFRAVLMP